MIKHVLLITTLAGLVAAQPVKQSYVGAGGCQSSNCHGGTSPLPEADSRILGNEFATWSAIDKHSRAFNSLREDPRSKRMGEVLRIADVTTNTRCTVCHAVGSRQTSVSDGVACEACHGPAADWLGSHLQVRNNSSAELARVHADSVQKGMTDTKKLDIRANMCLSCHVGRGTQIVDHEMIAAGHPDLAFELETFTAAQPAHFRLPKPAPENALPRVREWAVGQSAALADGMRLIAAHAAKNWPEFSDLECYQCHHNLYQNSWRIQLGYGNRKPGALQANLARFEVMRKLVALAAPDQAPALEAGMRRLENTVAARFTDGPAIEQAATVVEHTADQLTTRFVSQNFDQAMTVSLIRLLKRDIQQIAGSGVNSAEQATMSLDALTAALGPPDSARQEAITALYNYLEHPATYDPRNFAALYQKAAAY